MDEHGNFKTPFVRKYHLILILFSLAIALSLIFYLLPFSGPPGQSGLQKVYFADNITPAHLRIIELFNTRNAGRIEIVPVDLPFSKFNTNERKELLARTLRNQNSRIDIFSVDQIWVPRFAKWAEPLSRYFARSELDSVLPAALKTCYNGSILVSIPMHIDIGLMYYRRDIINRMPDAGQWHAQLRQSVTWEELIELGTRNIIEKPLYLFQGDQYEGLVLHALEIFGRDGGELIRDGALKLTHPAFIRACRLMVDLIHKHGITPFKVTTFNEGASYRYALEHNILFFRGWPSFYREMMSYGYVDSIRDNLNVAALPHFRGQDPVSALGGWNLMISRHSSKTAQAAEFLRYVLSGEGQKILMKTAGYLPARESIYGQRDAIGINPELPYFKDLIDRGIYRLSHPRYTQISGIIAEYLHLALQNRLSVPEALRRAEEKIKAENYQF